jgi:hypothetical protein
MVKSTFDPGRYGTNAMYRDTVQTATDATGNMIGTRLENSPLLSRVAGGIGGGLAQGLSEPRDLVDGGNFVEKAGTGAVDQTASSLATGGMDDKLGKGLPSKMAQSVVRTAITADFEQSGGALAKETVKSGAIDWARTAAADSHAERMKANEPPTAPTTAPTPTAGAESEVKANPVETTKSESSIVPETPAPKNPVTIENANRTTERAKAMLDAMAPADRAHAQRIVGEAQTPQQQALFERAVAAGRTPHELDQLRVAMKGVADDQLATEFTGYGVKQLLTHSCVPSTAQSALADVDPVYAFQTRNNPVELMLGVQTKAMEDSNGKRMPRSGDPSTDLFNDPLIRKALANFARSDEGNPGMHGAAMKRQPLHNDLVNATGSSYDVLTSEDSFVKGDGTFVTFPHDRIAAATMDGLPVMFGEGKHQRAIMGTQVLPDGSLSYLVRDPLKAGVIPVSAASLDKDPALLQTIALPAKPPKATPTK